MTNPVALVTGATGGIGRVIAQHLLDEQYTVIACGRNVATLRELEETNVLGGVHALSFDVGDSTAWERNVELVLGRHAPPEVLVCAHGAAPCIKPTLALTPREIQTVWRTDVLGAVLACQTVGSAMVAQQRGCIVIVSSLHAHMTYPQRTAYSMAKSALCGLVRSLALEWGPYEIRTNAVLPWQVETPRTQALIAEAHACGADLQEAYLQRSPMRRLVQPEDVAQAVLALVANPACNGVEWVLDGGVSQSMWYQGYKEQRR